MSNRDSTAARGDNHTAAAEEFVDRAYSQFETEIAVLYLFGSTARGEASGLASDVDILVVLADEMDWETADSLRSIAYDVMLEYGPVVELHVLSETEFEHARPVESPSSRTSFTRDARMSDSDDSPTDAAKIEDQLRQARQAVSDAEGARDAELSDVVIVNRLYYACFHAAQAVLYDRGYDPSSHGGVISLFGSEVVMEDDVPRERGRLLNRLSDLRKQGDYGYGSIDRPIDTFVPDARKFVTEMETLCAESETGY
jgi:uncharacterized protein (UPF0332 family)/predicted nucleotidyltransferase